MRVLVAIDADACHEGVLAWARRFPEILRELPDITLLHVLPIPLEGVLGVQDQTYDLDLEHLRRTLQERCSDLTERYPLLVRAGQPGPQICEEAKGFDLVVVGSTGRSQMSQLLLGSTSAYVVHHAPCAVLVLRPPSEKP